MVRYLSEDNTEVQFRSLDGDTCPKCGSGIMIAVMQDGTVHHFCKSCKWRREDLG